MFIRIKKRLLSSSSSSSSSFITDYSYRFVIVQSYRSKGRPRQRVVKYLGSTRLSSLKNSGNKKKFLLEMIRRLEHVDLSLKEIAALKLKLINTIYHLS